MCEGDCGSDSDSSGPCGLEQLDAGYILKKKQTLTLTSC